MKQYSFSQLVNIDELRTLCEEFTQLTGFTTAILDLEGTMLVATGWQDICLRFHRCAPGTAVHCRVSDVVLADKLLDGEKYYQYRCGNGLIDIAVPIIIDGVHMASLYTGQFLFEPPDPEVFRQKAVANGFDEASYLDALGKVPIVTEQRARQAVGFLCRLAEMIGSMGLARKQLEDAALLIENSPAVLFRWKASEGLPIEFVSDNVNQFGYSAEEICQTISYTSLLFHGDLRRIEAEIAEHAARGKDRFRLEYRIITKKGAIRWVEQSTVAERNAKGELVNYRSIILDITDRKEAIEALRFTQYAVDNALSQAFWSTAEGRIFYVNDAACRALGYSREELLTMSIPDIAAEIPPAAFSAHWRELREKSALTFETTNRRKDGSVYPVEVRANHVVFDGREYNCAFVSDISERKQIEENLRHSEQKYRDIVENAPIGIFRSSLEGKFLAANPALARILKYDSPEELIQAINAKNVAEAIYADPERRNAVIEKSLLSKEWNIREEPFRCKDGSIVTLNFYHRTVPGTAGESVEFEGFGEDITERKQAEEALRLTQYCVDNAAIGICILSEDRIIKVNEQMCRNLGYTREELTSMSVLDIDPLITKENLSKLIEDFLKYGCNHVETQHRRKDGTFFPVDITTTRINYEGNQLGVSFIQDITERKMAEDALRESEERLRLSLAAANQAFYDLDVKAGSARLSPEFPRILGFSPEDFPPTIDFLREQIHPEDLNHAVNTYLATVEGETEGFSIEYRLQTRPGGWKWVLSQGKAIEHDGNGKALRVIGILADISERKKIEEQIRASLTEKTILLKEIHHRVKNNLQIISSLLDLQAEYICNEQDRIFLQDSQNRIRSMALIHQKLYQSESLASIDFDDYLHDLASYLLSSSAQNSARIGLKIEASDVFLKMDEAIPCGLIVCELISNSLQHAFPDGRKGEVSVSCRLDDDCIALRVSDNGIGLPPGFDFTNAESLGLQLVCMLVQQLRGTIDLERDGGTSFMVRFRESGEK